MTMLLAYETVDLDAATTRAVPTVRGARVRVVEGVVWATTSGDTRDLWLSAGDELTITRNGRTVLESSSRSTIELLPPCADGPGEALLFSLRLRVQRWLGGVRALQWLPADVATVAVMLACIALAFAAGVGFSQAPERPQVPTTTATQFASNAPESARHVMACLSLLPRPGELL